MNCVIAFRWMPEDLTNENPTLVQVMAWCRQAPSHYLSQCWPRFMLQYGVTRLQWVRCLEMHLQKPTYKKYELLLLKTLYVSSASHVSLPIFIYLSISYVKDSYIYRVWTWSSLGFQMSWHIVVLGHQQPQCWLQSYICFLWSFFCYQWFQITTDGLMHDQHKYFWKIIMGCCMLDHEGKY